MASQQATKSIRRRKLSIPIVAQIKQTDVKHSVTETISIRGVFQQQENPHEPFLSRAALRCDTVLTEMGFYRPVEWDNKDFLLNSYLENNGHLVASDNVENTVDMKVGFDVPFSNLSGEQKEERLEYLENFLSSNYSTYTKQHTIVTGDEQELAKSLIARQDLLASANSVPYFMTEASAKYNSMVCRKAGCKRHDEPKCEEIVCTTFVTNVTPL